MLICSSSQRDNLLFNKPTLYLYKKSLSHIWIRLEDGVESCTYKHMTIKEKKEETVYIPNDQGTKKPMISLVISALNESSILLDHLTILDHYMKTLESQYDWELILINDGSDDSTGALAALYAQSHPNTHVIHHQVNQGLGQSLQDGFAVSRGDYIVTFDIDLSCSPEHIQKLLSKIEESGAKVVIASPTMKGGSMKNVPWLRKTLSVWANRFLSFSSTGNISNLTFMVRAYNGPFIRSLYLRSKGMDIMPEIINKTLILKEKIVEIPGHLDWSLQNSPTVNRRSSMKILKHTVATIITGFLLRPFMFFIFPGLLLLLFSLYPNIWMLIHFFGEFAQSTGETFFDQVSEASEVSYRLHPHTFFIGLISLVLSIQLIAIGLQSLQSKHYFEELFNLSTQIYRKQKHEEEENR